MGNPEKVVRIGEAGAGQLCKVCNQMVIAGTLGVVAEAFALAKKSGIDAERMREALLGGFASSRVLEVHVERILKGNFKPGFKTKLFAKDLKIAAATLGEYQVAGPITAVAQQEINARMAAGAAEEDYSGMAGVVVGWGGWVGGGGEGCVGAVSVSRAPGALSRAVWCPRPPPSHAGRTAAH